MQRLEANTTMTTLRRYGVLVFTACFALALAACGSKSDDGTPPKGDAIAKVAPPAGQQWSDVAADTPEGGVVMGNPKAAIKLVEYASHTCPHCAEFSEHASAPLRDKYVASGVVSYEIRNQIHDSIDLTAAMLMRCNGPEAFHTLTDQFWANLGNMVQVVQKNNDALAKASTAPEAQRYQAIAEAAGLFDFFAARGIPRDQAMKCLADPAKARAILDRSTKQSDELNVTGTPTFFINGKNVGTQTWDTLEPMLQNAGAR